MNVTELIESYRQAAIRHGVATETGDYKVANKAHDEIVRLSHYFRRGSVEMQQALLALLDDESLSVRCWAAVHTLELAPDRALAALREIAAGPSSLVSFAAEMVLEQWEDGTFYAP